MPAKRGQSAPTMSPSSSIGKLVIAVSLACIALGMQLLLIPVAAVDSYQLFLGAVAVSSIYGGWKAGLLTFLICSAGKLSFFMPTNVLAVDSALATRALLFLIVAGAICCIGGRFHDFEQGLAAVLRSIGDAVITTDQRGRIRYMNPAAEALSGWPQAEAVKRNLAEVIHLRDQAGGSAMASRGYDGSSGRPWFKRIDANTVLDSRAGCAIPIAGSTSIISDGLGARSGAVIVLRDITVDRQAEQERDRLLEDLRSARARVKVLIGMLPICAGCKNIRDDGGQWYRFETYIQTHSEAEFTHGLCPECAEHYCPEIEIDPRPGMIQQADREESGF